MPASGFTLPDREGKLRSLNAREDTARQLHQLAGGSSRGLCPWLRHAPSPHCQRATFPRRQAAGQCNCDPRMSSGGRLAAVGRGSPAGSRVRCRDARTIPCRAWAGTSCPAIGEAVASSAACRIGRGAPAHRRRRGSRALAAVVWRPFISHDAMARPRRLPHRTLELHSASLPASRGRRRFAIRTGWRGILHRAD